MKENFCAVLCFILEEALNVENDVEQDIIRGILEEYLDILNQKEF